MKRQLTNALASLLVLALAVPAWLSATVVVGRNQAAALAAPNPAARSTLRVWNDHPQAVNVILLNGTDEYMLGTVSSSNTHTFAVPEDWAGVANVAILVTPMYDKDVDVAEEFQTAPLMLPAAGEANIYVDSDGAFSTLDGLSGVKGLPARRATLRVANHNRRQDANIVLLGDRGEYLLGGVRNDKTRVFEVPQDLVGAPDIRVSVTGYPNKPDDASQDFQSTSIELDAGHAATLVVANPVAESHLTLR